MFNNATLSKKERLSGQLMVGELFGRGHSHSAVAFPLRVVYVFSNIPPQDNSVSVRLLLSVPKRRLHHAVDRNRVKRQLREAYRRHKQLLIDCVPEGSCLSLALVWLDSRKLATPEVERLVVNLLGRVAGRLRSEGAKAID